MAQGRRLVIGGVGTHKDVHIAAVIDERAKILDTAELLTTARGHRLLVGWMRTFGELAKVGVEGTGAYGAGLARHLAEEAASRGRGQRTEPPRAPGGLHLGPELSHPHGPSGP